MLHRALDFISSDNCHVLQLAMSQWNLHNIDSDVPVKDRKKRKMSLPVTSTEAVLQCRPILHVTIATFYTIIQGV